MIVDPHPELYQRQNLNTSRGSCLVRAYKGWFAFIIRADRRTRSHTRLIAMPASPLYRGSEVKLTFYGHIKTAEQRSNVIGTLAVGAPPSAILAVPNVTAHPSAASVPTSYYLTWHCNYLWTLKG